MDVTDRLIEAATKAAVDDNRYEYAQALVQIAMAQKLADIAESLARIAAAAAPIGKALSGIEDITEYWEAMKAFQSR